MLKNTFDITPAILNNCLKIAEYIGLLKGMHLAAPPLELRRTNQLQGIQSSLAIEGNTLTLNDVAAIEANKPVLASAREIMEVQNALKVYQRLTTWQPFSIQAFKKAHQLLLQNLVQNAGQWRNKDVGIYAGKQLAHMAPPQWKVPQLMQDLFKFLRAKDDTSLLIKACIAHYEIEFIHPFIDGNGRIGRLWQQVILYAYDPIFEFIAVEMLIKANQKTYYQVLQHCDQAGKSTAFVEFMLGLIRQALGNFYQLFSYQPQTPLDRLHFAVKTFGTNHFTRKEYVDLFKCISTATASRDLALAVKQHLLKKQGNKATTKYMVISSI